MVELVGGGSVSTGLPCLNLQVLSGQVRISAGAKSNHQQVQSAVAGFVTDWAIGFKFEHKTDCPSVLGKYRLDEQTQRGKADKKIKQ